MSEGIRHVTGKEILQAIAHAKAENPKDTAGEMAFKIGIENIKETEMCRYVPISINVFCGKDEAGKDKWEYVPFHVRFRKVTTRSKIPSLEDRQNSKIKSVTIQFRNTSKGSWRNPHTGKEEDDPIGEALDAVDNILKRKIARLIRDKKLHNNILTVNMFAQREQKNSKTGEIMKKFDESLIRMEIKFRKESKDSVNVKSDQKPWMCDIYDATKPRPASATPAGEPQFYPAKVDMGGEEVDVNYGNIHNFIRGGSSVTGFLNCSQISLSGSGISLTPRFSSLIVKPSSGFKPNYAGMMDQLSDLGDAVVENIDEEPSQSGTASENNNKPTDLTEEAKDFDDVDVAATVTDGTGDDVSGDIDVDAEIPPDDDFGDL
jgi:hypothetical protein